MQGWELLAGGRQGQRGYGAIEEVGDADEVTPAPGRPPPGPFLFLWLAMIIDFSCGTGGYVVLKCIGRQALRTLRISPRRSPCGERQNDEGGRR